MSRDAWETRASDWVRWAQSPELDNDFWDSHLPEFLRLVPEPGRLTVDVGCGEGRLGRVRVGSGHRVVGFDASVTSVRAAATHPEGHPVAVADAVRLPLADDVDDLAIAFMSLRDVGGCSAAGRPQAEETICATRSPGGFRWSRPRSTCPTRCWTTSGGAWS